MTIIVICAANVSMWLTLTGPGRMDNHEIHRKPLRPPSQLPDGPLIEMGTRSAHDVESVSSTPRVRLPDTPPGARRASIRGGRFLNSHQASRSIRLPAVRSAPLPQHGYTGRPAPIEREVSQAYSSSSSADSAGLMVSRKRLRLASYSSRVTTSSMRRLMPATSSPVMATRRSVTRSLTSSKMAGA